MYVNDGKKIPGRVTTKVSCPSSLTQLDEGWKSSYVRGRVTRALASIGDSFFFWVASWEIPWVNREFSQWFICTSQKLGWSPFEISSQGELFLFGFIGFELFYILNIPSHLEMITSCVGKLKGFRHGFASKLFPNGEGNLMWWRYHTLHHGWQPKRVLYICYFCSSGGNFHPNRGRIFNIKGCFC